MTSQILVMGATGDLGAAIARQLSADGYDLHLHGFGNAQRLLDLADEVSAMSASTIDVRDEEELSTRLQAILPEKLDGLVYSAGVNLSAEKLLDASQQIWDDTFNVNVRGAFLTLKYAVGSLRAAAPGRVVLVSSVFGSSAPPNRTIYAASKAALERIAQGAAREEGESILINTVAPSAIWSENVRSIFAKHAAAANQDVEEYIQFRREKNPQGRFLEARECAEVISFLVSAKNTFVSGQTIAVDGAES